MQSKATDKQYLEKVDWLHRCLHVPTFLRQCQDLWELPRETVVYEIALPFVGLYFTVCCVSLAPASRQSPSQVGDAALMPSLESNSWTLMWPLNTLHQKM